MHDVIVIGAGPSGLMAAQTLAQRGHDVAVLEEHPAVGYPVHCTGVLGLEAFHEFDLPRNTILGVARSAQFWAGSGRGVVVDSERIRAAIVDRGAFDAELARRARAAGATLWQGAKVQRIDIGPHRVSVDVSGTAGTARSVAARACVLACGASYHFNRVLGLGMPRAFVQTAQVETPFPAIEHVQVHLGREIAPSGFAWLVSFLRGEAPYARIGMMCETRARHRFGAFLDHLGTRMGIDRNALPAPRYKILPLGPVKKTYAPRLLAVGDAAGLVKPTTGGGIYYSLRSGLLAAEVLDEALRRDALGERSLQAYERRWRAQFGSEIRVGLAFRAIAAGLSDRAINALIDLAKGDGIIPLLKEKANFNWHRDAALALLRNAAFRRIVLGSLRS